MLMFILLDSFIKISLCQKRRANLFVDLVWVGQFAVDGGAAQWGEGHGLHGDELDFVGEPSACICCARHPIDVFKDGGRGQLLVCAIHRRRT